MAINVQARGSGHQLRVTHKLLDKPFFFTFPEEERAREYGAQLHALLERGIVPQELIDPARKAGPGRRVDPLFIELARDYEQHGSPSDSDRDLISTIHKATEGMRVSHVTFAWIQSYVAGLKAEELAPGTIRKRIGLMGRIFDRHKAKNPEQVLHNPFRELPVGYSQYDRDAPVVVRDEDRKRRLEAGEEEAILAAVRGVKRDDRQRAWVQDPDTEFELLYTVISTLGLRLLEAYRLRVDGVDAGRRLLHVDGSKGARGAERPRIVPLSTALAQRLIEFIGDRKKGLVFSYWNGTPDRAELKRVTGRLSRRFATLFEYAGCPDLTEHDLRHEATCRWVTMRSPGGGWLFSDTEICKIMGWADPRMMLHYASLRGEDLSSRLA
jgi:integrase